jgi:hypothetical protein
MIKKKEPAPYVAPLCVTKRGWLPYNLCSSPAEGENEPIDYEDWNSLIS